jgi:hypothetical protein
MDGQFDVYWRRFRHDTQKYKAAECYSWNEAKAFLTCIDNGLRQYFAYIDDGETVYYFLVTRGAGPLEVISMQDYPNLSIDDVLFR